MDNGRRVGGGLTAAVCQHLLGTLAQRVCTSLARVAPGPHPELCFPRSNAALLAAISSGLTGCPAKVSYEEAVKTMTPQRSGQSFETEEPRRRTRARPFAVGTAAVAPPTALCLIYPTIGLAMAVCEFMAFMIVVATALYGSSTLSDRAFRLLRWLADRPEPHAPSAEWTKGHDDDHTGRLAELPGDSRHVGHQDGTDPASFGSLVQPGPPRRLPRFGMHELRGNQLHGSLPIGWPRIATCLRQSERRAHAGSLR
jgi:hypothetical protein